MCGINGIVDFNKSTELKPSIQQMNIRLAHRGPDNDGIFVDSICGLGHRRLSIIDLSEAGNQPYYSEDKKLVAVFNGEIYNYKELQTELSEYKFASNSDTEVVLKSYLKWGEGCLDKLIGMFAFAIWDTEKKQLFVARDRMGVKPLYYFIKNGLLAFSSEIRALTSFNKVPRKVEGNGLFDYLQYQTVHTPNTLLQDVFMLKAGHMGWFGAEGFRQVCYWDINVHAKQNSKHDYRTATENVYQLLKKSVQRRLVADVPFGAFLSGGIDSTAVVGLMSEVSSVPVKTFSVTFAEEQYTEEQYSRLVANKFSTQHTEIKLSANDFKVKLPEALRAMDHPSGDGPNTYVVSEVTKQAGVTMALSGIGGDELFAGYPVFNRSVTMKKYGWLLGLPAGLKMLGVSGIEKLKPSFPVEKLKWFASKQNGELFNLYPIYRALFNDASVGKLLNAGIQKNAIYSDIVNSQSHLTTGKLITDLSKLEILTYLQDVLLRDSDQMSMAHALEIREPFMDHELIEYVLSLPDAFKTHSQPKQLLIDAMGQKMPQEVYKRKKMGFTFPWKTWMQQDLKEFCAERIHSFSLRSFSNKSEVELLWKQFNQNHKEVSWAKIWHIVVLEEWMQTNQIYG